jgi:hypothetical protein
VLHELNQHSSESYIAATLKSLDAHPQLISLTPEPPLSRATFSNEKYHPCVVLQDELQLRYIAEFLPSNIIAPKQAQEFFLCVLVVVKRLDQSLQYALVVIILRSGRYQRAYRHEKNRAELAQSKK